MAKPKTLTEAVDRAISDFNRRFLNDPDAIREAQEEGDRQRKIMVKQGMTYLAMPGDELPDGSVR